MPKKGHTEEQILAALHEGASGTRVAEVCRRMGISQATYFLWKKKLKRLVADLSRDRHILQEIVAKKL